MGQNYASKGLCHAAQGQPQGSPERGGQTSRDLSASRHAGPGTAHAHDRLPGRGGVSPFAGQTSLHQRRWLDGRAVSGHQRYNPVWGSDPHALSQTMECGTLSSIAQTECFPGKVSDPDGDDPNQSFLCSLVRVYQNGTAQNLDPVEPFCAQSQTVFAGPSCRLRCFTGPQSGPSGCVR